MLLVKTKNLKLVVQNSENTIFYFFEFVEQMTRPRTELQSLLNLSITDAKLFVYKKTIFDLQVSKTRYNDDEHKLFRKLKHFTLVYKKFISILLVTKTINEIIEEFDILDSYVKRVYLNKSIDECLDIDVLCVNRKIY